MISVLTITYKRHHLLEEAIQSFLLQENAMECEMVVINDNPDVDYIYNHERVRIINHKERFPSIAAKLEWGFKQCKHNHMYRLDDDDLLTPNAISDATIEIVLNNEYEIYRSKNHYFFVNNKFECLGGNINNGNIYTKNYLDRIVWPTNSFGEDDNITFAHNAKIYDGVPTTMIYRWGMGTLHVSGMGPQPNQVILDQADKVLDDTKGEIILNPHFDEDYYSQLP